MKTDKKPKHSRRLLYIKNMVCDRCIRVVREELERAGVHLLRVELGEVETDTMIDEKLSSTIKNVLQKNGFELIEDKNAKTIEAIKTAIIQLVHHNHDLLPMKLKYSDYIAQKVGKEYHALSILFSSVENITIEQYIIRQKIERVKELMKYDERSLSEISYMMNYSSVQHLSNQFKSVTGFTPSEFKKSSASHHHKHHRISIDKVK